MSAKATGVLETEMAGWPLSVLFKSQEDLEILGHSVSVANLTSDSANHGSEFFPCKPKNYSVWHCDSN